MILFASIGSDLAKTATDTAETFGLDWPHFIAQVHQLSHRRRPVSTNLPTNPFSNVLEERRQRIAEGLANAEKIKAELARTEAMQREVLDKANAQATKLIEEARAAAARVQEQETQKAIAQAEQIIAKAREATALERQPHADGSATRSRHARRPAPPPWSSAKCSRAEDQQRLAEETRRQLAA